MLAPHSPQKRPSIGFKRGSARVQKPIMKGKSDAPHGSRREGLVVYVPLRMNDIRTEADAVLPERMADNDRESVADMKAHYRPLRSDSGGIVFNWSTNWTAPTSRS
jgi:hypothetical protein